MCATETRPPVLAHVVRDPIKVGFVDAALDNLIAIVEHEAHCGFGVAQARLRHRLHSVRSMGAQSTRPCGHTARRPLTWHSADATAAEPAKRCKLPPHRLDPDSAFVQVRYPCHSTTWIRGSPVCIEWTVRDDQVQNVRIELCQVGSAVSTVLTACAPNSGWFVLERVPWGVLGDGFYIRVTDAAASHAVRQAQSQLFCVATTRWPVRYPHLTTSSSTPPPPPAPHLVRFP
ncbi:hypothetical protein H310_11340 [Aphanomyces invadans]|uniref:Uncharacterized protein n=1 Tax=Aphanomyces invadans TaxID=157072 RepID=A0A024TLY2_9STRA|nr:hypothetical protein H310_11340 [Aphanomyces invadans]ETV95038.1 hypothetical protein H310_11340 [Aphanomyces invadans]|eukprot:XP_008876211.1 hypothetical protein H310_11340 [Aphanomyces invadans]